MGDEEGTKGYRLLDVKTIKICVSRGEGNDTIVKEILRRPKIVNRGKPPLRLIETIYKVTAENDDPKSYKEALNSQEAKH